MIAQGEAAAKNREPSAEDKKRLADANLAQAKVAQISAEIEGTDAANQLNFMAMASGKAQDYGH